jgi:hypothetical protein
MGIVGERISAELDPSKQLSAVIMRCFPAKSVQWLLTYLVSGLENVVKNFRRMDFYSEVQNCAVCSYLLTPDKEKTSPWAPVYFALVH